MSSGHKDMHAEAHISEILDSDNDQDSIEEENESSDEYLPV